MESYKFVVEQAIQEKIRAERLSDDLEEQREENQILNNKNIILSNNLDQLKRENE